ncbi:MAG: ribosome assembly cofactor RimP [Duncaniella sp.]|nr:ribosome assembly cofactor RimP [Duncaniella sp.]
MIDKNEVRRMVEEASAGTDAFVVDVTVSAANDIVVELDSATGIDLDFCADLNRELNEKLDRDAEDYSLEVGTASLTAPFKVKGQYEKNLGNEVEVLTRDGKKLKGILTDVTDSDFTIEVTRKVKEPGAKRPVMVAEPVVIPMDQAKQVCYVINFK